jgi:hypothetical protein
MFGYDTLSNYYQTNFALIHHHKYSLAEIENMIPWEKFVYLEMLMNVLKEEQEQAKMQEAAMKSNRR